MLKNIEKESKRKTQMEMPEMKDKNNNNINDTVIS